MKNFPETTEESRLRWEANADCWDARMGDDSNFFHCCIVRPHTEELLDIEKGELVLDAACGNGNFSQRLADMGARVVAFDYSEKLIEHAKRRCSGYPEKISFIPVTPQIKTGYLHLCRSVLLTRQSQIWL